jgi:hypothetical protein
MKLFPRTLLHWLLCLLVVVLVAAVVSNGLVGYRINKELTDVKVRNLINSAQNISDSGTLNANAYGEVADATRDLMRRNIATAVDQFTARFDSTMIRVEKKIELLEPLLVALTNNSNHLSVLMLDTNNRLIGEAGLFAALTDTTRRGGEMINNQDRVLQALVTAGTTTIDEVKAMLSELRGIVASDEWKQIRSEVLSSMRNVTALTKHTDETVIEGRDILKSVKEYLQKYAPGILAYLEKISETSRYQKAALPTNIFRLLAIGLGTL